MTTVATIPSTENIETQRIASLLQPLLVELIHLQLQTKQAHWNIQGPLFGPVHSFLDEMADSYRNFSDEVAERIRALGVPADGRLSRLASSTQLEEISADLISDQQVLQWLDKQLTQLTRQARNIQATVGELDAVTEDLVLQLLATLEKQAWMIRSQITR